ncbi:lysozyme [Burkholderia sp. Bp8984]|uniref:lysozyme n=1 Tax=Burkholderia sp. Bp8984 TaxID=2184549 RepID=UPI000F5A713D|nr:lysozyme [Burkholderia sp. Bp8984]RQS63830.1 lysozyme [Burkholderia sp. Bp8984]
MSWLEFAVGLAKQFEGCSLTAYPDPATHADPWTIGYGATGYGITRDTVWTQDQADADLQQRMKAIGIRIDQIITAPISDEQKGALCDFAYNIGIGALQHSTLLAKLNSGDMQRAADEFPKWDMAAGRVIAGLQKRRDAERALFILGSNFSGAQS